MGFGLSIGFLNSSKFKIKNSSISFYRDIPTLELLTSLITECLIKRFNFNSKNTPVIQNIGAYLDDIFRKITPPKLHPMISCFFSHLYVYEQGDDYPKPYLLKIDNQLYITPLFKNLSYSQEVLVEITDQQISSFFKLLAIYDSMPFSWQIENSWIFALKSHVIKRDNRSILVVANLSNQLKLYFYSLYNMFLDTFKTYPFTPTEKESKEKIYNYLTTVREFLKIKESLDIREKVSLDNGTFIYLYNLNRSTRKGQFLDIATTGTQKILIHVIDVSLKRLGVEFNVEDNPKLSKYRDLLSVFFNVINSGSDKINDNTVRTPLWEHLIYAFCSHLFISFNGNDNNNDKTGTKTIPLLLKYNRKIFVLSPSSNFVFSNNVISIIHKNAQSILFKFIKKKKVVIPGHPDFSIDKSKYCFEDSTKKTNYLMLPTLPPLLRLQFFNFYTLLIETFNSFTFDDLEKVEARLVLEYLTNMRNFLASRK